ncbi:hypothetical protein BB559_003003 [Furculomyces boomerangus]|uniref:Uncharacterized protein n=1 Tax=Furculomyces boomerangus TaxID=61424 RepID=A0A2T9YQ80_9FUNG|nr:hypothetical protein BB559_003003 [Furculomyces boomerangus]
MAITRANSRISNSTRQARHRSRISEKENLLGEPIKGQNKGMKQTEEILKGKPKEEPTKLKKKELRQTEEILKGKLLEK